MKRSEALLQDWRVLISVTFLVVAGAAMFLRHTLRSEPGLMFEPRLLLESRLTLSQPIHQLPSSIPETQPQPHCPFEAPPPVIRTRVWQTVEEEVIPRGNEVWERASKVFDAWNDGFQQLDEGHFYEERPDVRREGGGGEAGFAWYKYVTDLYNSYPVQFAPRAPPASIQLPRCDVEKMREGGIKNGEKKGGVSICAMVRNEEDALAQWLNYYYYLGVSRVVLYDDGSTDGTAEVAAAYSGFVEYVKWEPEEGRIWQADQVGIYNTCIENERVRGAGWVGTLDVDEFVVFDDPNERLDSFLEKFDGKNPDVGSVSFSWRMMHSDAIALPDPAFTLLDVGYACRDESDGWHHVKTIVKADAFARTEHPHYVVLKDGFHQYDVSGGVIDPPGPFASRSIHSPARLNHYRLLSLHEWMRKASKRHSRQPANNGNSSYATKSGDYGFEHLQVTLGNCFPVRSDPLALMNVIARQGCL